MLCIVPPDDIRRTLVYKIRGRGRNRAERALHQPVEHKKHASVTSSRPQTRHQRPVEMTSPAISTKCWDQALGRSTTCLVYLVMPLHYLRPSSWRSIAQRALRIRHSLPLQPRPRRCRSISYIQTRRESNPGSPLPHTSTMAPPPLQKQYMSSGSKPKKEPAEARPSAR